MGPTMDTAKGAETMLTPCTATLAVTSTVAACANRAWVATALRSVDELYVGVNVVAVIPDVQIIEVDGLKEVP